MRWLDFVKEVEKQIKESKRGIKLEELEIAYIEIHYTNDIEVGFSYDKLVVVERDE